MSDSDYLGIVLPMSVVSLVHNIAKLAEISALDGITMLLNLHYAINKLSNSDGGLKGDDLNKKSICIFIFNIMRLSEKTTSSKACNMSSKKVVDAFASLGVSIEEINKAESETFQRLDFKLLESPQLLEDIHGGLASLLLGVTSMSIDELLDIAIHILMAFFLKRKLIYERVNSKLSTNIDPSDSKLIVAAVILNVGRTLQISDRAHNFLFDKLAQELADSQSTVLNLLTHEISGVIFDDEPGLKTPEPSKTFVRYSS